MDLVCQSVNDEEHLTLRIPSLFRQAYEEETSIPILNLWLL